jgi:hypothetical protein
VGLFRAKTATISAGNWEVALPRGIEPLFQP